MEKHHATIAKLKAKPSAKRLSEDTNVNKVDVDGYSEDSYTLMCSIYFGDEERLTFPSKITIVGTLLVPANSTLNSVIHAQVPA